MKKPTYEELNKRVKELEKAEAERMQIEKTIRLQSEVVNNMTEGVYLIRTSDGMIVYANPTFEKMFGYDSGELINKNVSIVNAPGEKSQEETANEIIQSLNKKGTWSGEVRNIKKDGTPFWCHATVSTFVHPDYGEVWVSVHEDITKRKQLEKELKKQHDNLEKLVDERTAELRTANEQLKKEITERKKAEEELQKLIRAVEQSPTSIVITDTKGDIKYVNPKFTKLTGYTFEEVIGENPRILKSGKQSQEFYKELWDTITSGREWKGEFHNKKKNGELYWEFASISPMKNQEGVITHFVGVKEDITERKKAEEELKKAYTAVKTSISALFTTDLEANIIYVNPAAAKMWGLKNSKDMVGKNSLDYFAESSQEKCKEIINTLKNEGFYSGSEELIGKSKDGTEFICEVNAAIIKDEFGEPIGMVGSFNDITERKKAEDALLKSEKFLKDAQRVGHLGSWDLNTVTGDLYWSDEAYRIYGLKPQEFVPTYEKFLSILYQDDIKFVQEEIDAALQNKKDYNVDFRFVRPNGKIGWIHCEGEVTRDNEGKPIRFFGTQIDITDRKKLEEERVKRSNIEAINKLIVTLNHEMNQPLSVIISYASFIMDDAEKERKLYKDAKLINDEAWKISNLVKKISKLKEIKTTDYTKGTKMLDLSDIDKEEGK